MKLAGRKREYIAKSLAKTFEYILSILVIGYLVAAKLDPKIALDPFFISGSVIAAVVILMVGVFLVPVDNKKKEGEDYDA